MKKTLILISIFMIMLISCSEKTSAVNACAEQVALAKEYAQMANGWNFSYDEENETLVFVENV